MIEQLLGNWVCWAIFALALYCYQQLFFEYLLTKRPTDNARNIQRDSIDADNLKDVDREETSGMLISALPLLGLLGTIIGLLECFRGIAVQGASSELVSGGIADALLTTELGLVCAIPGWLLRSWVQSSRANNSESRRRSS